MRIDVICDEMMVGWMMIGVEMILGVDWMVVCCRARARSITDTTFSIIFRVFVV